MRRSHRKSRYGCKECKQRHAKCDESRPVCGGCRTSKRHCSYLNSGPTLPPSLPVPSPSLSPQHTVQSPSPGPSASSGLISCAHSTPSDPTTSQSPENLETRQQQCPSIASEHPYSMVHLELLHHFEHGLSKAMGPKQPGVSRVLEMALQEAFAAPFFMDELLAFSAAHRSTLTDGTPGQRDLYRTEATRLQTRALARYSAVVAHEENPLAVFLFSAFLGQHVLFDTFSLHSTHSGTSHSYSLAAFLDQLVHCLSLHRGIAVVAGRSWPTLIAELRARLGPDAELFNPDTSAGAVPGTECADLMARLAVGEDRGSSELSPASREACREAVAALQRAFDVQRSAERGAPQVLGSRRFIGVQEWLVRVSGDYINLIARRQPEALVILAYYSVLLHYVRDYWIVGNVGAALGRSICSHLGGYWADWLEWPNRMLEDPRPDDGQGTLD